MGGDWFSFSLYNSKGFRIRIWHSLVDGDFAEFFFILLNFWITQFFLFLFCYSFQFHHNNRKYPIHYDCTMLHKEYYHQYYHPEVMMNNNCLMMIAVSVMGTNMNVRWSICLNKSMGRYEHFYLYIYLLACRVFYTNNLIGSDFSYSHELR